MPIELKLTRFRRRRATIPVPVSDKTRIATLTPCKIDGVNSRFYPPQHWSQVEAIGANILIGRPQQLRQLATLLDDSGMDQDVVDTAVLVATELGAPTLNDVERVVLWQTFGVPVYELLIAPDGQLIACECEAREGWHLQRNVDLDPLTHIIRLRTGGRYRSVAIAVQVAAQPCACGRKEPRLIAKAERQHAASVLAATA